MRESTRGEDERAREEDAIQQGVRKEQRYMEELLMMLIAMSFVEILVVFLWRKFWLLKLFCQRVLLMYEITYTPT